MTATIYRLPPPRRGPPLEDNPKVRKALSMLCAVHPYLFLAALEAVREYERTGSPAA